MPGGNCPACLAPGARETDGLSVCPSCGLARAARPRFTEARYDGLDESAIYSYSKSAVIMMLLGELRVFMPGGGRLLDVGCASGEFMKAAAAAGWRCSGVEVSEHLAGAARTAGFEVHSGTLESFRGEGGFDAVIMYELLSLVDDPSAVLAAALPLLRPGGRVFIREYNASFNLRARAFSRSYPLRLLGLRPGIVHNWNYTPAAMKALLERAGFESVELRNARPSSGDPYRTGGRLGPYAVSAFKKAYFALASAVSALTGGKVLISSVFDARARKPGEAA